VKEHPDGEPCRAEAVKSRNNDDGNCDKKFERKRIYEFTSAKKDLFLICHFPFINGSFSVRALWFPMTN
jgi:hypothetical protein